MAILIESATRTFSFNGKNLPDPDGSFSPEEVMEYYAMNHPELTNGSVEGPEMNEEGEVVYKMVVNVGKKG